MMMDTIRFFCDGVLITDGIELRDGRALPGGWSQYRLVHCVDGHEIAFGWLENGAPDITDARYTYIECA